MSKVMRPYGDGETQLIVAEKEQLVDLDETYAELDGDNEQDVVSGLESYVQTGKLSRRHLEVVGIKNLNRFEPSPSEFNARLGGESFIGAIIDGFIEFIKGIIAYIRRIIDWVISKIKIVFGFGKNAERLKAAEAARGGLEKEFEKTLRNLNVLNIQMDLKSLMEKAPPGCTRIEYVQYLKNKFDSDSESVERLLRTGPVLAELVSLQKKAYREITERRLTVKRKIDNMRMLFKANRITTLDTNDFTRTLVEFRAQAMDTNVITETLTKVIDLYTDIKFSGVDEFNKFIGNLRTKLTQQREFTKSKMNVKEVQHMYDAAEKLTKVMLDTPVTTYDLSTLDPSIMKDMIRLEDAEFIKEVSGVTGDKNLVAIYQGYSASVKKYLDLLEITARFANEFSHSVEAFCVWKYRCDALFSVYLTNDLVAITEHLNQLKAEGVDAGKGVKWTVVDNSNLNVIKETIAESTQALLNEEVLGLKKRVNNFSQQLGLGVKVS